MAKRKRKKKTYDVVVGTPGLFAQGDIKNVYKVKRKRRRFVYGM